MKKLILILLLGLSGLSQVHAEEVYIHPSVCSFTNNESETSNDYISLPMDAGMFAYGRQWYKCPIQVIPSIGHTAGNFSWGYVGGTGITKARLCRIANDGTRYCGPNYADTGNGGLLYPTGGSNWHDSDELYIDISVGGGSSLVDFLYIVWNN